VKKDLFWAPKSPMYADEGMDIVLGKIQKVIRYITERVAGDLGMGGVLCVRPPKKQTLCNKEKGRGEEGGFV